MPISDYANAFFFARQRRVTFKCRDAADCPRDFSKSVSSAESSVRRLHFLLDVEAQLATPYFRRSTENVRRKNTAAKNKSPAEPGFCSL